MKGVGCTVSTSIDSCLGRQKHKQLPIWAANIHQTTTTRQLPVRRSYKNDKVILAPTGEVLSQQNTMEFPHDCGPHTWFHMEK